MAVKKTVKKEEVVEVVETAVEENTDVDVEVAETTEEVTPEVEIEVPEVTEPEVEVDSEKTTVNTNNKPNGNVKIKMRVDHKCCIAMERYDLKEGKTYTVPENVKRILNKAGLLAPL